MGRLRFNKKAEQIIKNNEHHYFLNSIDEVKEYTKDKNVILEIGMGKGDFIITQAQLNPNDYFIGIEKYQTVAIKALNKVKDLKLNNLKFLTTDATNLNEIFLDNSIQKIYLNFSDPWPKARHEKRRLTSNTFLGIYKKLLQKDAVVEFKTDNESLYSYSIENLLHNNEFDIQVIYYSNNIYLEFDNPLNYNNIQTEYERKFLQKGSTIKKIIFSFK